jgi:hypothetical protein
MGASTRALQNFFDFKSKDAMIQDFMLKIFICFNSPISEHLTPMHQTPHVFPILLWN